MFAYGIMFRNIYLYKVKYAEFVNDYDLKILFYTFLYVLKRFYLLSFILTVVLSKRIYLFA